jgi:hypothetical protein
MRAALVALLAAALSLSACTFAYADGLPEAKFELKQAVASTGSNIPRRVVTGSKIPINRRYADLTDEQQEIVKSQYEAMRPTDEPPFPANGLLPLFESVHKVQQKVLAQGELVIFVDIDAAGEPSRASVIKSPDPQLTRAVAEVLMLTKFKPAVCRGQPCAMGYPFRMSFGVDR